MQEVVRSMNLDVDERIKSSSRLTEEQKIQKKMHAENLRIEQSNAIKSHLEAKKQLITNLQAASKSLKELQTSLKKGIMS